MEVPPREVTLNSRLVGAQKQHVDVCVSTGLPPQVQVDSPATCDPPRAWQPEQFGGNC
jgi:hypothetical protein